MANSMQRSGILTGGNAKITWVSRDLFHGLTWFRDSVEFGVQAVVEAIARQAEDYMKSNAPWKDRTRDARNTLRAEAYHRATVSGITLAHGVHYGRWLELRWGGKYAIVIPAMEVMGRRLMEAVAADAFNKAQSADVGSGDVFGG